MVKKSSVGDNLSMLSGNWSFEGIENQFDEHAKKSIPFYVESHVITKNLTEYFLSDEPTILDIGCSTGTLLSGFHKLHGAKKDKLSLIGVDPVASMVDKAKKNLKSVGSKNFEISQGSFMDFEYDNIDIICSLYTFQFIHPSVRRKAYKKVFNSLKVGGAFICFEKVKADNPIFNELFLDQYSEFKFMNGYSEKEILQKTRSLRGVMRPFTESQNIEVLLKSGFKNVSRIFKWLCFEGYLAIK